MDSHSKNCPFQANEQDYYLALEPMSGSIKGAVVLMPGFGQPPKYVFPETMIPNEQTDNIYQASG